MSKFAIVVLGIARSGTSALAGTLSNLGVPFGTGLKKADRQNPKGNYEHFELSKCNQRALSAVGSSWSDYQPLPANWLDDPQIRLEQSRVEKIISDEFSEYTCFGIKDPRLVPLFDMYVEVFNKFDILPVIVTMERERTEVIESIRQSGYYHGEYSTHAGEALYDHYQHQIALIMESYNCVKVHHRALMNDTENTIKKIITALPFEIDKPNLIQACLFIDQNLYRVKA